MTETETKLTFLNIRIQARFCTYRVAENKAMHLKFLRQQDNRR